MKKLGFFLLVMILLVSCSSLPSFLSSTPTPSFTPTHTRTSTPTSIPTLIPTPTIAPPAPPKAGFSNLYGRVSFRGEPLPDCYVFVSGSAEGGGSELVGGSVGTDSEGRFIFFDLLPGIEYELYALIPEALEGIATYVPVRVTFPADTNYEYGEYVLIETDLVLLSPEKESILSDPSLLLQWESYPGAAYYHVELSQANGEYANLDLDTEETTLDITPPLACTYYWNVTAYDDGGTPLAKSDLEDGEFKIVDDALSSCEIHVLSPFSYADAGHVEFSWEPIPLAASYKLTIYRDDAVFFEGEYIIQEDGSLRGPTVPYLLPALYQFWVSAHTEDGIPFALSAGAHILLVH